MAIQKIDDIYELLKGNTQKKRLVELMLTTVTLLKL